MQDSDTDRIQVTQPDGNAPEAARGPALLFIGLTLFLLGLVIITLATFRFDLVKNQVFEAHAAWAPFVAGLGYVSALAGLVLSLVHFIREG